MRTRGPDVFENPEAEQEVYKLFSRVSRYLFSQVSFSAIALLVILLSSLWLVHSLKFIELILKSRESFGTFFKLSLLALPDLITILLPITILIAVVAVYVRLRADNELVVMSACGYSQWALARPALAVALVGTCLVYFINIFVLHSSFREMRDVEHRLRNTLPNIMVKQGVFNSFGNLTIYVQRKRGQHHLEGVLAYVQKPDEDPYTVIAKEGNFFVKQGKPTLILRDGNRQIKGTDGTLSVVYFEETILDLSEPVRETMERPKKPYELSFKELVYGTRDTGDVKDRQRLVAEALQRLLTPWYCLGFVAIALAIFFAGEFRRTGYARPIIYIVGATLLVQGGCLFLVNLGTRHWQALPLAFLLLGSAIFLSIFSLLRQSLERAEKNGMRRQS
jgi:lipopolysaccharide export system permease protein